MDDPQFQNWINIFSLIIGLLSLIMGLLGGAYIQYKFQIINKNKPKVKESPASPIKIAGQNFDDNSNNTVQAVNLKKAKNLTINLNQDVSSAKDALSSRLINKNDEPSEESLFLAGEVNKIFKRFKLFTSKFEEYYPLASIYLEKEKSSIAKTCYIKAFNEFNTLPLDETSQREQIAILDSLMNRINNLTENPSSEDFIAIDKLLKIFIEKM